MSAARTFDLRAYRVANPHCIGRTIAEIEALPKGVRVFVLRVRSGERILEATRDLVIHENDVVAVAARHEVHAASGDVIGPEVSDLALLDIPVEAVDVVVTNRLVTGKTLGDPRRGVVRAWRLPVEGHPIRDRIADCRSRPASIAAT